MTTPWPDMADLSPLYDEEACSEINWLTGLIGRIRSVRLSLNIPAGQKLALCARISEEKEREKIERYQDEIINLSRLNSIAFEAPEGQAARFIYEGVEIALLVSGIIDIETEKSRIKKDGDVLQTTIDALREKLEKPGFRDKAPEWLKHIGSGLKLF
jgi:valyl-tRNA synthetase